MSALALLAARTTTWAAWTTWAGDSATVLPRALDPDPDTARQWVAEELSHPEYADRRSLLQRLLDWLQQRLADVQGTPGRGGVSLPPFVIAVLVGVVLVALVVLATRVRRERRTVGSPSATVLGDSTLTAAQLRERAERAIAEGRYDDAVLDLVRAVARDADDRTLLHDAPTLTAREVGQRLAEVFPEHGADVTRAAERFDAVAYGRLAATREDALDVRSTTEALRRARPRLTPVPGTPDDPDVPPVPPATGHDASRAPDLVGAPGGRVGLFPPAPGTPTSPADAPAPGRSAGQSADHGADPVWRGPS